MFGDKHHRGLDWYNYILNGPTYNFVTLVTFLTFLLHWSTALQSDSAPYLARKVRLRGLANTAGIRSKRGGHGRFSKDPSRMNGVRRPAPAGATRCALQSRHLNLVQKFSRQATHRATRLRKDPLDTARW